MMLSKTEQDYIKAIYEFETQEEAELVSLKQLADRLEVSAPTVTEMAKRSEKKDLIIYKSYRGVQLTDQGLKEASFILKAHRVWEYFLLQVLKYQADDVHEEAEALEHATTPQLLERLYAYLGKPEVCPHGNKIPQEIFWYETKKEVALNKIAEGIRAEVDTLPERFLQYLQKLGIKGQPTVVKVCERFADGTVLIEIDNGEQAVVSPYFQEDVTVLVYE